MACTDISSNAGVKIYIGPQAQLPSDMLKASWEAVAGWEEISQIASIGARGIRRNVVEYKSLDGLVCKQKGATDYGTLSVTAADVPGDAGQALMTEAVSSPLNYPFRVVHDDASGAGDPTTEYFPGMVTSWGMAAASDSDSIREREGEVGLNGYLYVART